MKIRTLLAASAAIGMLAAGSAANALIVVDGAPVADDLPGATLGAYGMVMLEDFDAISNPFTDYVGLEITTLPNPITNSAPPPWSLGTVVGGSGGVPVDPTDYASVQGGQTGTFKATGGFYFGSFSFYMGSPDEYNKVTFKLADGTTQQFVGNNIWGGTPNGTGDRTQGYRVYYDFGGAQVSSITFSSNADAFEFDGLAGTLVPEPGTWALMIMGFGGAGAMLRRRKMALA